ncbi:MAG: carbohydrate ABC transporter permease [Clostridia bacterium]|nr:carbohydrate ABC transporter permease [Clostridia bacterium]
MKKTHITETLDDRIFACVASFLMFLLLIICVYPLYFVVIASFSRPEMVSTGRVILFPRGFTTIGYDKIFQDSMIFRGFLNSAFYTVAGTLINLIVTLPAAYALSRKDLVGRNPIMIFFIVTMYFNGGMIPTYLLIQNLGLYNNPIVLLVCTALVVYNMIIARTFFENTIPYEMLEAAKIDGCSNTRFFCTIVLPLSKTMIAVIALYYGVQHWNSYMNALLYIDDQEWKPLQLILRELLISTNAMSSMLQGSESAEEQQNLTSIMQYGIIVVSTLPMMIVFPFVQKYFVKGVMIGAVKG